MRWGNRPEKDVKLNGWSRKHPFYFHAKLKYFHKPSKNYKPLIYTWISIRTAPSIHHIRVLTSRSFWIINWLNKHWSIWQYHHNSTTVQVDNCNGSCKDHKYTTPQNRKRIGDNTPTTWLNGKSTSSQIEPQFTAKD